MITGTLVVKGMVVHIPVGKVISKLHSQQHVSLTVHKTYTAVCFTEGPAYFHLEGFESETHARDVLEHVGFNGKVSRSSYCQKGKES